MKIERLALKKVLQLLLHQVMVLPQDSIILIMLKWSRDLHTHVIVKGCLFGAVKLTKNDDPNKYSYSDMVLYSIHHHYF